MRKGLTFLIALGAIVFAVLSPALAAPPFDNFPPGVFQSRAAIDAPASVTFQGIGDVVTGASALAWGSRARVYTAAQASTSTSLCDLVDSSAPTVVTATKPPSELGGFV